MARKRTKAVDTVDTSNSIHAPSARIFTEWTPAMLRSAERQAEYGNLSYPVSICEWLLTDDRVCAALDARIEALMGLDVTFEAGKGARAEDAKKALEEEDWEEAYPESELKQILRWGILLGVAPARHNWQERPDHGNRILPYPTFWHPQTLTWDPQKREWRVRDDKSVEHVVVPGDGEWILHTPSGQSRPWSSGLWRSLSRWVLMKAFAQTDWARHSEKASVIAITAPEKATKEQRREVAEDLAGSGADAVVALAAGFDIKLVEVTANTEAIYNAQIKAANDAIAIRIRGSNLTTEVKEGSGSKAATEAQARMGDLPKLKADSKGLTNTLKRQSLPWWAEFNYGDQSAAPRPVWPVEPEEDKSTRATMVKTLGEGLTIWDKLGFDIDPEATQEEFGLSFLSGRSREREPDPVPAPAVGGEDDAQQATPQKASARAALVSTGKARAGAAPLPKMAATSGFVQGQLYADDLVDGGQQRGGEAMSPFIGELLQVIDQVKDSPVWFDELRDAVLSKYRAQLPPDQLREVLASCMVLAEMAGHAAVRQDAD